MTELRFSSDTKHRKGFFTGVSFSHPAKMILPLQLWLYENYTKPGDVVLDPMAGSGTALVGCSMGRHVICVELEQKFIELIKGNWEKIQQRGPMLGCEMGHALILQGDARDLESLLAGKVSSIITSPPFQEADVQRPGKTQSVKDYHYGSKQKHQGQSPDNIANLVERNYGDISAIITSPPYAEANAEKPSGVRAGDRKDLQFYSYLKTDTEGQIGNLPYGSVVQVDHIITSPPYEGSVSVPDSKSGARTERLKKAGYDPKDYQGGTGRNLQQDWSYHPQKVDSIITSPPYADERIGFGKDISERFGNHPEKTLDEQREVGYSPNDNNIGNLKAASYLEAMYQVYKSCFAVLKDGGLMILVVKNFIRDKKEIRLDTDTRLLCERAGFAFVEEHHRVLTSQSFWRTIYYQKFPDAPRIDWEYVLVFKRSLSPRDI